MSKSLEDLRRSPPRSFSLQESKDFHGDSYGFTDVRRDDKWPQEIASTHNSSMNILALQGQNTENHAQEFAFSPVPNSTQFHSWPTYFAVDSTPEYSIFVGDLAPDLREEDLVKQFLQPSAWPPSHPFAIAHAHAQHANGNYTNLAKIRPAPFTSTKSAKIMKDPLTGASRGFGFVRFAREEDCARALVEMQGMIITPMHGSGRPLRVCTATPKNRAIPAHTDALQDQASLYQQLQQHHDILTAASSQPILHEYGSLSSRPISPPSSYALSHTRTPFLQSEEASSAHSPVAAPSSVVYTSSALDPNNTTVFVGGLSSLISEETLKTFFAPFGEIIYVKIPPGKGCGFVQFVKKGDAERAIERMQGFPIGGGRIRLSWGRSQGDKAAAAAAQAVAQTAQMSHLANLAGLGALTPAQLNHLAGVSLVSGQGQDASSVLLRKLAAAAAAAAAASHNPTLPAASDLGKDMAEMQRFTSQQSSTTMEQQHRQAQYQYQYGPSSPQLHGGISHSMPSHTTDFSSLWAREETRREEKQQQHNQTGARPKLGLDDDDYLASVFPSLRFNDESSTRRDAESCSTSMQKPSLLAPTASRPLEMPSLEAKKMHILKHSDLFSPFSPPVSPPLVDERSMHSPRQGEGDSSDHTSLKSPAAPVCSQSEEPHMRLQDNSSPDNLFKRYLESERQRKSQEEYKQPQQNDFYSACPTHRSVDTFPL